MNDIIINNVIESGEWEGRGRGPIGVTFSGKLR
jgi:hypothetical protein